MSAQKAKTKEAKMSKENSNSLHKEKQTKDNFWVTLGDLCNPQQFFFLLSIFFLLLRSSY